MKKKELLATLNELTHSLYHLECEECQYANENGLCTIDAVCSDLEEIVTGIHDDITILGRGNLIIGLLAALLHGVVDGLSVDELMIAFRKGEQ